MTYINKRFIIILQIIILLLLINVCLKASGTDWSITTLDNPAPGYFRFDFSPPSYFFLVDNYGNKQFLDSINPQPSIYNFLLRDGNWISYGITKYYLFNQDRQLIGSIPVPSNYVIDFHAVEILTNGHYLILCDTILDIDLSSIVPNGQKHAKILTNNLVEIDTSGRIYWEWKAYDHLKITDVTPDIDLTQLSIDFTHVNSFAEDKDSNILISFKNLDEITKINKTTGQIMWRMGGSMCKNNQFTFKNDNINGFIGFSHQHSIAILPNGNLLMYDNGGMRNTQFSRAVEYQIDQINKTATKIWDYGNSPPIFQSDQGSVFRLPNGNTLINWGSKQITEVRPDNSKAFELTISAPNLIYKAYKLVTRMNAVSIAISSPGDYNFNDNNFTTGINLSISSLTGSGLTSIEKHNYAPPTGDYLDSDFTFIYPYRWVFSQNGISNISGVIKININSIKKLENPYR
ncbi:MAG: aryl-sulfate sulfotransferase, partial [FCB group bacterium]